MNAALILALNYFGERLPCAYRHCGLLAALFVPIFIGTATAADDPASSSPKFDAATAAMQRYVDEDKVAGSVLIIVKNGETLLLKAVGMQDRAAGTAMETDSLFRIASQSKAITTTAAMMLVERGKIALSDPVSKYIPSFKNTLVAVKGEDSSYTTVPAKREITVHDLMSHTSGISYGWDFTKEAWEKAGLFGWYYADKDMTIQEALLPLSGLPMANQPGEKWQYGHSTDLLGAVIEVASRKSLKDFFHSNITGPLGMDDTFFYVPDAKMDRLAKVYGIRDGKAVLAPTEGTMATQGHYATGPRKAYSGGAGLVSTAADYSRFLTMLAAGGSLDGKQYLKPETIRQMISDQLGELDFAEGFRFGYGFWLKQDDTGETLRYGWGGAYHSNYTVSPKSGLVVVYLTQLIPANGVKDWEEIEAAIDQALQLTNQAPS